MTAASAPVSAAAVGLYDLVSRRRTDLTKRRTSWPSRAYICRLGYSLAAGSWSITKPSQKQSKQEEHVTTRPSKPKKIKHAYGQSRQLTSRILNTQGKASKLSKLRLSEKYITSPCPLNIRLRRMTSHPFRRPQPRSQLDLTSSHVT